MAELQNSTVEEVKNSVINFLGKRQSQPVQKTLPSTTTTTK